MQTRSANDEGPGLAKTLRAIRAGDEESLTGVETSQIETLLADEPDAFHAAIRRLARPFTPGVESSVGDPRAVLAFLDRTAGVGRDARVEYLRATADLYQALSEADVVGALRERKTGDLLRAVDAARKENPERYEGSGAVTALLNTLGKIESIADRDVAAEQFRRMRDMDESGIISSFYVDLGAMTYYSDHDIDQSQVIVDGQQVSESLHSLDKRNPTNRVSLVISVDPKFYRIYAHHLYFYAQQLPEIDFTIIICGYGSQARELRTDGNRYLKALAALNKSGEPNNIHHFVVPVPKFVAERKTFYAAARFLFIDHLLERYPNLYLMDADLVISTHPGKFLKTVSKLPFAAPRVSTLPGLSPWRRNMAGNLALNREASGTGIIRDLQHYLIQGLRSTKSWMLDQNAITYAVEKSPGVATDLSKYARPFNTAKFMATWEKNYAG